MHEKPGGLGPIDLGSLPSLQTDEAWLAETVRAAVDASDTLGRNNAQLLASLRAGREALSARADGAPLELGEVLGSGGMGEVLQGFQPTLRRPVAVKRLHDPSDDGVSQLLREAWVAGYLEHPNILPVHDLAGDDGAPLLVMKLIEGVPWADALADPTLATGGLPPEDPVRWQLQVLLEVCQAVRFAHARGVVHLDLKPANVMLGRYGEVYLVDWGLAGTFRPDAPAWLPRVGDLEGLVGTPVYMAPEQAQVTPERIGPPTDVYQLGGILYELVTGQRPRQGSPLKAALMASRGVVPDLSGLPAGLRAICARALQPDPADRYPDAGAFAQALRDHLQHREAERLADEGWQRLTTLRDTPPAQRVAAERLGAECAFAFEQALQIWPDSQAAQEGRHALVLWQVARDLEADAPEAAEAHLARLTDPPIDLAVRVKRAKQARAARDAEAEALRRHHDESASRQERVVWLWGIAVLWVVWNTGCGLIDRHLRPFDYATLGTMSGGTFAIYLLGRVVSLRHFEDTAFNRRAIDTVGVGLGIIGFLWFGGWALGVPPLHAVALSSILYVLFSAILAVVLHPRMWAITGALGVLSAVAGLWPTYAFEWVGLSGAVCALGGVWIWSKPEAHTVFPTR